MGKNSKKYVYLFGKSVCDGNAGMKNLLGGKGANLAEMAKLGLPVPPGFTITTECCADYFASGMRFPSGLAGQLRLALDNVERQTGLGFGDRDRPLLLSCRSGARSSMPGMMETVLNIGLTTATIPGMIKMTGNNERFVYDAYRRLIMMYSDVVMEKAAGIVPADGEGIRRKLDLRLEALKRRRHAGTDAELKAGDLKALCEEFKSIVAAELGRPFPDDAREQLEGGVDAVFKSWNGPKAVSYRRIENIPDDWGTAVNVQTMVFGNTGNDSATGVAFTRDPATGDNRFYGEWLANAQGEDVVAGVRTPNPLNSGCRNPHAPDLPTLEAEMPEIYRELVAIRNKLERHYRDMLDIEFTIQHKKLYMLQCRVGKRGGAAALKMAVDMMEEKLINAKTAVLRVSPAQLDELLHPILDPAAEKSAAASGRFFADGLPAGPGGAVGEIVFSSSAAKAAAAAGRPCILVREETNPEDVEGMRAASGILTARGGMTSHAALVCRGWGKCCVAGAGELAIDETAQTVSNAAGKTFKAGDFLSLNGSSGRVYCGALATVSRGDNRDFKTFMKTADKFRKLAVRANADTPEDAKLAIKLGASGIGLFRTEHMFYGNNSEKPLFALRKMILSRTDAERRTAIDELFPYVKAAIKNTLKVMKGLPVTIRFLDPPLHEFVPHDAGQQKELADAIGIGIEEVRRRAELLKECNPMMGHRGVRLGITFPAITAMQTKAVLESAAELAADGIKCRPELMIPVTCDPKELVDQKKIIAETADEVRRKSGLKKLEFKVGTMIEVPRAALLAGEMAVEAEFFSFGTNDLTQLTFGFSRDDAGSFLNRYLASGILAEDPFRTVDTGGVGLLIRHAVKAGRKTRPKLKTGICGEQGGEAETIKFCHELGLDYVSCSPFRVPPARLAAAQAAIKKKK
ncbi:MAG: pyruvate, phosphate dikinase [Victivallaceae bacterium]|nr:pyruvate, phosphate dikinase [Victivallaceae bacterium]